MNEVSTFVACDLLRIGAVHFRPTDPVLFTSGLLAPFYIDVRLAISYPREFGYISYGFNHTRHVFNMEFDLIAGVELGGVPFATSLMQAINYPMVIVRKQTRQHGLQKTIEGIDVKDKRVLLIEDTITTGSSALGAVKKLRRAGAVVDSCISVVDYGLDEVYNTLGLNRVNHYSLTTFSTILDQALRLEMISTDDCNSMREWIKNPIRREIN